MKYYDISYLHIFNLVVLGIITIIICNNFFFYLENHNKKVITYENDISVVYL